MLQRVLWRPLVIALVGCALAASLAPAQSSAPANEAEPVSPAAPAQDAAQLLDAKIAVADSLLDAIDRFRSQVTALENVQPGLVGEDSVIVYRRIRTLQLGAVDEVDEATHLILDVAERGGDAGATRERLEALCVELAPAFRQRLGEDAEKLSVRRAASHELTGDALIENEIGIDRLRRDAAHLLDLSVDHVERMEALGLDGSDLQQFLVDWVPRTASVLMDRMGLGKETLDSLSERAASRPDDSVLQLRLQAAERRQDSNVRTLRKFSDSAGRLGLDTSVYESAMVQASGELTPDALSVGVARQLLQTWYERTRQTVIDSGPSFAFRLLVFLAILFAASLAARAARRMVVAGFDRSTAQISHLLRNMVLGMVSKIVLAIGFLVALAQFGVSVGPMVAGLGVAGFVIGFALQDTLSNFAAGAMILFYRPYDVGHVVEAGGVFGKVDSMSLVSTTILTFDNQTLVVPNSKIWGDVIRNVTKQSTRRVDMVFGISYSDDIPQAESILAEIIEKHDMVLADPEPLIRLNALGESSVDFIVRPWVKSDDYWDVFWDVTREVKMRFDREGISIPFPQRDVHVISEAGTAGASETAGAAQG